MTHNFVPADVEDFDEEDTGILGSRFSRVLREKGTRSMARMRSRPDDQGWHPRYPETYRER